MDEQVTETKIRKPRRTSAQLAADYAAKAEGDVAADVHRAGAALKSAADTLAALPVKQTWNAPDKDPRVQINKALDAVTAAIKALGVTL